MRTRLVFFVLTSNAWQRVLPEMWELDASPAKPPGLGYSYLVPVDCVPESLRSIATDLDLRSPGPPRKNGSHNTNVPLATDSKSGVAETPESRLRPKYTPCPTPSPANTPVRSAKRSLIPENLGLCWPEDMDIGPTTAQGVKRSSPDAEIWQREATMKTAASKETRRTGTSVRGGCSTRTTPLRGPQTRSTPPQVDGSWKQTLLTNAGADALLGLAAASAKELENNNSKIVHSNEHDQPPPAYSEKQKRCKCKNSACLKLYCVCFSAGEQCGPECACTGCVNNESHAVARHLTYTAALERRSLRNNGTGSGCNCKRSKCLQKYCECFQARVACSDSCRCRDCHNHVDHTDHAAAGSKATRRAVLVSGSSDDD